MTKVLKCHLCMRVFNGSPVRTLGVGCRDGRAPGTTSGGECGCGFDIAGSTRRNRVLGWSHIWKLHCKCSCFQIQIKREIVLQKTAMEASYSRRISGISYSHQDNLMTTIHDCPRRYSYYAEISQRESRGFFQHRSTYRKLTELKRTIRSSSTNL